MWGFLQESLLPTVGSNFQQNWETFPCWPGTFSLFFSFLFSFSLFLFLPSTLVEHLLYARLHNTTGKVHSASFLPLKRSYLCQGKHIYSYRDIATYNIVIYI